MNGQTARPQLLTRALDAIEKLQARLDAAQEPIAVIGLGCRLPGAENPDAYWRLLRDGVDAVTDIPPDRWDAAALYHPEPATPGRMYVQQLGTVGDLREFDAGFFGIAPREAASMDPQQRLLLEVAWEALEDAAIPPASLAGSPAGVFMAACGTDYFQALLARGEEAIDPYFASGTVHSMMSGRLSYILGLTGPSLSVDTACSSSLVAVHLACRALRSGECDMALAGGVNRILLPTYGIAFAQSRMLSPDGRCKTFDACADGYGRAEGCGVVVLKRLSRAVAVGDRILAVIRGSAVNQDGATSGLTVPNGPAQAAVIRAALRDGGVDASAVGLIEAHGTGTSLGDPIEMGALRDVFAAGRDAADPLWVGSVKTNIGHAEGAAGIAGLIKLVLALQRRSIPAHLHLREPNPLIDWAGGALAVPRTGQAFAARGGRWIAGVSSFGFSGTNAHVVLEAAPEAAEAADEGGPGLYVVSAKSEAALSAAVERHAAFLEGSDAPWGSLCHTAGAGRSHFSHRAAVVAADAGDAARRLRGPGCGRGRVATGSRPKLAFLFTGQGSVWPGMGLAPGLRRGVFASVIEEAETLLADGLRRPLREVLAGADDLLSRTDHAQVALYVLQSALVATWRSWGVEPALVLGHSVGEYAAAHAAGVFDFATGLRLVLARGRLMQALPAGGGMVSVALDPAAAAALAGQERLVTVGAQNGPQANVLSGPVAALERLLGRLPSEVGRQWLEVSHGFHSPLMQPAGVGLAAAFAGLALSAPRVGFVSTVSGRLAGAEVAQAGYWVEQVEAPVRFASGMAALSAAGATGFVEIGPQPVLLGLGRRCVAEPDRHVWTASLRAQDDTGRQLPEALGALYLHGVTPNWNQPNTKIPKTNIPTYPWQRATFWAAPERAAVAAPVKLPDSTRLRAALDEVERDEAVAEDETAAPAFAELAALYTRLAALPPSRQQRAALLLGRDGRAAAVDSFYTRLTSLFAGLEQHAQDNPDDDIFLTFAPFPAIVPDFSWIMTSRFPEQRADHFALCLAAQRDMRAMLFRHVDFGVCRRVLDLGCGTGSDVVALARRHPHLTLVGQTISRGQADIGRQKAKRAGAADRVTIRHADSATTRSEQPYDLVFGFEVIHHIADKAGLFATIAAQLIPGGRLVAADFIVSEGLVINDDATMSGFLDTAGWADGLARNGMAVTDVIDISEAVANFLHDPSLEEHLDALGTDDADIRGAFRGFVRLGELLRHGDTRYVLLDACRVDGPVEELRTANKDALAQLGSYDDRMVSRWLYERGWRDQGGIGRAALRDVAMKVADHLEDLLTDPAIAAGRRALPELEALSDAYAGSALASLSQPVAPQHRRLTDSLRHRAGPGDPATLLARLRREAPELTAELALVQRCGESLAAVLSGAADPLSLLFPGGDLSPLTHIYEQAAVARALNAGLAAVCSGVSGVSGGFGVRVLEIGGGTGGSTSWVVDALAGPGLSYCFTDVSEAFLSAARVRFGAVPGFSTRRLDIEHAPSAQGFAGERFDLVIAANVLHATRDVRASLRHAASLLAPGGTLVLLEGTAPRHWVDLTFGLTEGWWRFADHDLRPSHPLLPASVWEAELRACGLETAVVPGGSGLLFDQALVLGRRVAAAGDWLVVAPGGHAVGAQVAAALGARLLDEPGEVAAAVRERAWDGVLLLGLDPAAAACRAGLDLVQGLSEGGFTGRLVLATRDAVRAAAGDGVGMLGGAALWGLGAVAGLEHPEWRVRRVDLPASGDVVGALQEELGREDAEDQVAWRGGRRLVARLTRREWPGVAAGMAYRGTWMVTGGLGGLGLAVAAWLGERGVARVILVGRGEPGAAGAAAVARLRGLGVAVEVRIADVRDRAALCGVVEEAGPALRGVVHAAGVLDDGTLDQLDWGRFDAVLGPKVSGAWHLHELTLGRELDGFVLFSSAASLLGNAGQGNHAAANAYLDGLAQHRHALGLPALSVNWGAWADIGAAADALVQQDLGWSRFMSPPEALAALELLLEQGAVCTAVLPIFWNRFARSEPFFSELRQAPSLPAALAPKGDLLTGALAEVLGIEATQLDPDLPLRDYGFDSLMAISLRNRIRAYAGVDLPLATILQGVSMRELADAIADRNGSGAKAGPPKPAAGLRVVNEAEADAMLMELLAEQSEHREAE